MTAHRHPFTRRALRRSPVLVAALLTIGAQAATLTVTNGNDSGPGSLRAAIASAQAGDTINLASGPLHVTLAGSQLQITQSLTIHGNGGTIDAGYQSRVLSVAAGSTVVLEGLTLTGGAVAGNGGGGGQGGGSADGAGIHNSGHLTLRNVSLTANAAGGGGAGGASDPNGYGGGGAFAGVNQANRFVSGAGAVGTCAGGNGGATGAAGACSGGQGGTPTAGGAGGAAASGGGGGGGGYGGGGGGGAGVGAGGAGGGSPLANGVTGIGAFSAGGGGRAGSTGFAQAASGGGGGSGVGWGWSGGQASGGIFNASGATLVLNLGTRLSDNVGAGGGGNGYDLRVGGTNNGGQGVGALWNEGTLYQGANVVFSGNRAASGGAGNGGSIPAPANDVLQNGDLFTSLPLSASVTGAGSVSATSPGVQPVTGGVAGCTAAGGATCAAAYSVDDIGSLITFTATVPAGQTFGGWGGDCSGSALTCTVTMDQARSVTAAFADAPVAVPTLGQWGLMLLGLLAAGLGGRGLRQRRSL